MWGGGEYCGGKLRSKRKGLFVRVLTVRKAHFSTVSNSSNRDKVSENLCEGYRMQKLKAKVLRWACLSTSKRRDWFFKGRAPREAAQVQDSLCLDFLRPTRGNA